MMENAMLRGIPKMDVLLGGEKLRAAREALSDSIVKDAATWYLSLLRDQLRAGQVAELPSIEKMEAAILNRLQAEKRCGLRKVINGTGIVLHTNLGRAPLGDAVFAQIAEAMEGYCNLEYDLEEGHRGNRHAYVEDLICRITGAPAAMVVNNNAAAVFLMLSTWAKGKNVAISRGELVEIGGSFRIPEILEQSGARLVEIGTTNKTKPADYEAAIQQQGAEILLKVHTSNFKIIGFTEDTSLSELVQIGAQAGCPVFEDLGSAFLAPPELPALHNEPTVGDSLAAGADLVCFSGDKLFGSTQAGILVGQKKHIQAMRKNPLFRMMRLDKLSLAALAVTLNLYRDPYAAAHNIPVLQMLAEPPQALHERADRFAAQLSAAALRGLVSAVTPFLDEPGGGSLPGVSLEGWAIELTVNGISAGELERSLRGAEVPVITRILHDKVCISVRTLRVGDEAQILKALRIICGEKTA